MNYNYTAPNGISYFEVEESNLRAEKSMSDFGGPNMWNLYVKTSNGRWEDVQWMNVYRIQEFFKTKLPIYNEQESKQKYSLK
jgi:hypothetical protein